MARPDVAVAGASRPYYGEIENGDCWRVDRHGGVCRVAVIDALGHGPEAAAVSQLASDVLAAHPELGPADAVRACHGALHGTRGAGIAIACVDPLRACLSYAGIGNIEARLWQPEREQRPTCYRGIVGVAIRTIRPIEFPLQHDWLLVVHTDGVSARFELEALPGFRARDLHALADSVVAEWARATDDATAVVLCSKPDQSLNPCSP